MSAVKRFFVKSIGEEPCLEGEELGVYCRREESGCRLAIKKADGKAAVLAAVKLR